MISKLYDMMPFFPASWRWIIGFTLLNIQFCPLPRDKRRGCLWPGKLGSPQGLLVWARPPPAFPQPCQQACACDSLEPGGVALAWVSSVWVRLKVGGDRWFRCVWLWVSSLLFIVWFCLDNREPEVLNNLQCNQDFNVLAWFSLTC